MFQEQKISGSETLPTISVVLLKDIISLHRLYLTYVFRSAVSMLFLQIGKKITFSTLRDTAEDANNLHFQPKVHVPIYPALAESDSNVPPNPKILKICANHYAIL